MWSSRAYSFIGFFGQHTPFSWTTPEEDTEHHIMPYDITEVTINYNIIKETMSSF